MIRVTINGKEWGLHPETNIANLLSYLKIYPEVSVVEVNKEVVSRSDYCWKIVQEGDQIEIVRFMAGG